MLLDFMMMNIGRISMKPYMNKNVLVFVSSKQHSGNIACMFHGNVERETINNVFAT